MGDILWSHYSEALFDAYLHSDDNLIVQACPGAGKTRNIEHLWSLDDKATVYLVFSKHNQLEAEGKLTPKVNSHVRTLNSLGHRALLDTFGRVQLDDRKVWKIIDKEIRYAGLRDNVKRERKGQLKAAVDTAKSFSTAHELSWDTYDAMLSTHDLEYYDGMFDDAQRVLSISDEMTNVVDFGDQIRLPALYKVNFPHYETVLGDEVQDFSPVQALMVSHLNAQKYVLVGDRHQSIFGFRGAMNDSMDYLTRAFHCRTLPLSITYRCGKAIVQQASRLYPGIEAWDQSDEGVVRWSANCDASAIPHMERYDDNTMVVCRMNAPLVQLAYRLLRGGIPCHVRGRAIGDNLIKLIQKLPASNVRELIDELQAWFSLEVQKATVRQDDAKLQTLNDKYESLRLFTDKCQLHDSVDTVCTEINNLFAQGKGITLSTVHKAKGLEAQRCFILHHHLYNQFATGAKQEWQKEQEKNIQYVAVTRAREELVYM